jgi:glycosyltransferase involved in cell wall biosynthesis
MTQLTHEVLIDVTRLVGRLWKHRLPTGVDRVGIAYVEHYRAHARAAVRLAGRTFVLPKRESEQLFQWLLNPGKRLDVVKIIARALLSGWRDQKVAGLFLFNTGHSGLERDDYPNMLNRMRVFPIFVVHDLIPITHPEFCRDGEQVRHVARMNNVLRLACGVVANSQATLSDLNSFADNTLQTMPPSAVGLLAPGISGVSPGPRPLAQPYFVVLSTIEPRKNHWMLLQIWRSLVESMGESTPRLVIIGQLGWDSENVVNMLQRCAQLKDYVIELPSCTDGELATYLHHAQALLFPSFAEGYGMPLIEALAFGVPVIASDLPVFREVAGEIPEYVDPLDGKRWGDLVKEYAKSESPPRTKQLSRLDGLKIPTWVNHFAKVDALLQQLSLQKSHV